MIWWVIKHLTIYKKFYRAIGKILMVLEEGTPWGNKAEFYIGLIKESFIKYMKKSDYPISFWDYRMHHKAAK